MKRLIFLVISFVMIINLFGCASSDMSGGMATSDKDSGTDSTQNSDTDFGSSDDKTDTDIPSTVFVVNRAYTKVLDNSKFPTESTASGTVNMAKNETEGIQISMSTKVRYNKASFRVNNSYEGIDVEFFRYSYLNIDKDRYPDPIIPITDGLNIYPNAPVNVLINFKTDGRAAAGTYKYGIDLLNSSGEVIQTFDFTVNVFDILYPDEPTLDTAFGLTWFTVAIDAGVIPSNVDYTYKMSAEEIEQTRPLYVEYYEYMLDHKVTPIELPYDILDDRADAYMSDPRVTSFAVPATVDDNTLKKIYKKLCTNKEWLEKAYIYPIDEPQTVAHIDDIIEYSKKYEQICPKLKMASSFFVNINYSADKDQLQILGETLDILCMKTANWNSEDAKYGIADSAKYGSFADRMNAFKKKGKTLWSYVCWEPSQPYANLLINEAGLNHRILFWQQYNLNTTGFLYWSVNWYDFVNNPWLSTKSWLDDSIYGDGILLFPGKTLGAPGPVGSLRFEAVRDGIEDFELLKIYEEHFGAEATAELVSQVSKSLVSYTDDAELFETVRAEMMQKIASETNN